MPWSGFAGNAFNAGLKNYSDVALQDEEAKYKKQMARKTAAEAGGEELLLGSKNELINYKSTSDNIDAKVGEALKVAFPSWSDQQRQQIAQKAKSGDESAGQLVKSAAIVYLAQRNGGQSAPIPGAAQPAEPERGLITRKAMEQFQGGQVPQTGLMNDLFRRGGQDSQEAAQLRKLGIASVKNPKDLVDMFKGSADVQKAAQDVFVPMADTFQKETGGYENIAQEGQARAKTQTENELRDPRKNVLFTRAGANVASANASNASAALSGDRRLGARADSFVKDQTRQSIIDSREADRKWKEWRAANPTSGRAGGKGNESAALRNLGTELRAKQAELESTNEEDKGILREQLATLRALYMQQAERMKRIADSQQPVQQPTWKPNPGSRVSGASMGGGISTLQPVLSPREKAIADRLDRALGRK